MSTDTNAFSDLYKANAAYFQRTLQLAQQGSRQWLDFGRHACTQAGTDSSGLFKTLTQTKTPQDFAELPAVLFDVQTRRGASTLQASAAAADIQAGLIAEAADAIKQWQHDSLAAIGTLAAASPWAQSFGQVAAAARKAAGRGAGAARGG